MTRTQLCDFFWPGEPIARARGNLRKLLTDSRKSMGAFVCSSRDAVWLSTQPYWFDVQEFERLTRILGHGDSRVPAAGATDMLRLAEAIRLYHGPFLAHFKQPQSANFATWLEQEQRLLHQRATTALTLLIDDTIQSAQLATATAYVRRLLEIDPYHEAAHGQFMRLLAHQDQRAEAIEHYQRYSQLVNKELKTTVEEEITDLYRQIRSGIVPPLMLDRPIRVVTQGHQPQPKAHPLPHPVTPLLGRDLLLAQLNDFLHNPAVRLITLTGLGGIGKSRVALAAAMQAKEIFQDNVYYIPIDRWHSSAQSGRPTYQQCYDTVVQATAEIVKVSADTTGVALDQQICTELRARTLLLIFDGFESIVEGASFLLKLMQEAPAIKILVASREVLQLPGELVIQLDGLASSTLTERDEEDREGDALFGMEKRGATPTAAPTADIEEMNANPQFGTSDLASAPAVQLFTSCAQRKSPTLTFTTECLQQIAEICALLEGNPLAIELAAGLTAHYGYSELITLLQDNIQVLQAVGRGSAQRHRSIEQIMEESWHLLWTVEQETLARLSQLPARFHRSQAIQLEGVSSQALIGLTAKSMLRSQGEGWYQLPHMVQLFAKQNRQPRTG